MVFSGRGPLLSFLTLSPLLLTLLSSAQLSYLTLLMQPAVGGAAGSGQHGKRQARGTAGGRWRARPVAAGGSASAGLVMGGRRRYQRWASPRIDGGFDSSSCNCGKCRHRQRKRGQLPRPFHARIERRARAGGRGRLSPALPRADPAVGSSGRPAAALPRPPLHGSSGGDTVAVGTRSGGGADPSLATTGGAEPPPAEMGEVDPLATTVAAAG